ncbi:putative ribonuclease H protein [Sesamum angolense]|uniref:Ribonuclease H protein n=1 Tax=Sesamum angolense TaxID=2727404 RepID=A0AAE1T489_9LAMI|nr:putative ribonuclease H protein [Sesamum angolense]
MSACSNFLPQWSWFTDYDMPGNRIWIAWDDELLDVDVLNLDVQFIHCRINIRCAHLSVLATVVYGANDSVSRRGLWQSLVTLADSISDEENSFLGIIAVKEIVACGNVWIDCWLMMLGYDCGRIRIINVLTLGLPITPHLCSEEILINIRGGISGTVQQLLQIDRHNSLLLRLEKCCKLVFFKATKLEQVMLQQRAKIQWLKGGDQCSRIFFRKVAMRRASKRVFQIINEDGHTLTTQEDVVNEFVSFYQRLLGGDRRRELIDLRYLRPWARHVLTQEESQALVQSVSREEIKDAFFDIAEDKAPGPDGYSSGFYKAAWPVIGEEMIKAILEFFTTGRLLKQVNTTILALILRQGLPMRCALKVDLRKAYDTVEWDFLSAVKGLRQGDPMSPFLFVLLMEMTSSSSVKLMWIRFGYLDTGWTSSPNCPGYIIKRVSLFCPVQHRCPGTTTCSTTFPGGSPSLRYLGLPLLASRLSISDCKPLLLKIDSRIKGWESIQLSFAGRLQLIKSVLMSLKVYWAMAFILPKGVIREVEKKMRTFLWKGNSAVGYPKVAWSVVCKPIEEGGQGIRDILALNKALMSRHLWNVIQNNQSSIWVKWIAHTRLRHKSVWTVDGGRERRLLGLEEDPTIKIRTSSLY